MVEKTEALQKELLAQQNEIAGIKSVMKDVSEDQLSEHTKVTIGDLKPIDV